MQQILFSDLQYILLIFENLKVQNKKALFNPNLLPLLKKFCAIKYK